MNEKILVVAFDGLDKELIEKYNLENLKQEEFGKIDNSTHISSIKTSELFASFITGKNYEEHGIEGLSPERNPLKERIIETALPKFLRKNIRGFTALKEVLEALLRYKDDEERYTSANLSDDTLFDVINDSRSMFVPSYNPGLIWRFSNEWQPLKQGYGRQKNAEYWDKRAYEVRKRDLLEELENEFIPPRAFLMCHFHRLDIYQHLYGGLNSDLNLARGDSDYQKLRKVYQETDKFAGEIKDLALKKGYDYVIFMSDHGLPTDEEHNQNAFYSCNLKLFESKTPHITDFYDRILELTENEEDKNE